MISRDQLLKPAERRFTEVELPTKGSVRIQSLNQRERAKYQSSMIDKKGQFQPERLKLAQCRLLVTAVVDDNGKRMLMDDDAEALLDWDSSDFEKLIDAVNDHCGWRDEVEDQIKNSNGTADVE